MRIGFTGTRKGMTFAQEFQLKDVLGYFWDVAHARRARAELHYGGQNGADLGARTVAKEYGYHVETYPCPGVVADEETKVDVWHEVFPPLTRNRNIVAAVDILVAAPETDEEELRSGTWATVRYARARGIPVVMLSRGRS